MKAGDLFHCAAAVLETASAVQAPVAASTAQATTATAVVAGVIPAAAATYALNPYAACVS
jgi:hypothetical protein